MIGEREISREGGRVASVSFIVLGSDTRAVFIANLIWRNLIKFPGLVGFNLLVFIAYN